ncbi:MAG: EpsG family protein [Prevotella sp.]|nr:EpsG family protein [Prevotella sp.]
MRIKGLAVFSFIFIIIVMAGNTMNADYEDYAYWYESGNYPIIIEPGYELLSSFFSTIGISFSCFHVILLSTSVIIAWHAISKLIYNFHLLLFVYLSYCIIIDTIQIRNTFATSLLLLGIFSLTNGRKFVFILLITIASTIHYSFIVFMVLLFYKSIVSFVIEHKKLLILISASLCVFAVLGSFLQNDFATLVGMVWGDAKAVYVKSKLFNIVYLVFPFLSFILASLSRDFVVYNIDKTNVEQVRQSEFADIILSAYSFLLLLSPLIILSQDTLRIHRDLNVGLVLLVTIMFCLIWEKDSSEKECIFTVNTNLYALLTFSLFCLWMIGGQDWPGYEEVFGNNMVFNEYLFSPEFSD